MLRWSYLFSRDAQAGSGRVPALGSGSWKLIPIMGGGLAQDLFEHAIKMSQRLEAHFIGDFADPQIRVEQEILGSFHAHTGDVIGEVEPGHLLEHLAEIEGADIDRLGYLTQRKFFGITFADVFLGAGDDRRFRVVVADGDLIADHGEVLGEEGVIKSG